LKIVTIVDWGTRKFFFKKIGIIAEAIDTKDCHNLIIPEEA